MQFTEVIERAKAKAGSYAKLAELLGARPQHMSDLIHGRRQWSPERVDEVCEIAGVPKEDRLRMVWEAVRKNAGKALHSVALGAAVTLLCFGGNGDARAAANGPSPTSNPALMYLMLS
ncbi:hypothetical protein [Caldimonas sp. KR1-144]|uniref:hypothetical protein n=1 Tax=Caldimonas sp. KR1-144 TaxID=3400911 RepID=UPI003C072149